MKKYLLPLGVAALLLSGCSGESPESEPAAKDAPASSVPSTASTVDSSTATVDAMGSGPYTFDTGMGTVGSLAVPGEAPADVEELRTIIGEQPVAYLTGNLDNREGAEVFDVYAISVFDSEGNKYDYEPVEDYLHSITSIEAPDEIYKKYRAAYDKYDSVFDPLERGDFVMVGPELPVEIAGVSVSNGFEDFGAMPAE